MLLCDPNSRPRDSEKETLKEKEIEWQVLTY